MASIVTIESSPLKASNKKGIAVISLDFSKTFN
jgi:hypothetical protein